MPEFCENAYFIKFYSCLFSDLPLTIHHLLLIAVFLKALFVSKDNNKGKKPYNLKNKNHCYFEVLLKEVETICESCTKKKKEKKSKHLYLTSFS